VPGDTAEDAQAVLAREIATEIPEQYQRKFLAMMVGSVCELVAQMFMDLVPEDPDSRCTSADLGAAR
jgi:hypothetical protein